MSPDYLVWCESSSTTVYVFEVCHPAPFQNVYICSFNVSLKINVIVVSRNHVIRMIKADKAFLPKEVPDTEALVVNIICY